MQQKVKTQVNAVGHIRALDGIRGAAVLAVFLYHALAGRLQCTSKMACALERTSHYGWAGVDVFFVLSGFLITTILLDARHAGNYFRVFYARRILRIFPLYYLVMGASLLLEPGHYGFRQQVSYWLNLSNLPTAFHPFIIPYLAHFWSLAIEEQFYFVWPTVIRRLRSRHVAFVCLAVILGVALAKNLPVTLAMNRVYPEFVYRLTPFRVDTLCGGALLAIIVKQRRQWVEHTNALRAAAVLGFALFAFSGGIYADPRVIRFGYSALVLAACALVALSLRQQSNTARIFSNGFLRTLGKYSYAFYLFHPYVVNYVAQHMGRVQHRLHIVMPGHGSSNAAIVLMLPWEFLLVFGMSALSWRFFEEPILKAKRHFRYEPRPEHYLA